MLFILACTTTQAVPSPSAGRIPNEVVESVQCSERSASISKGDVECLTQNLIQTKFPELKNAWVEGRIEFRDFKSSSYFLKTSFFKGKLSSDSSNRRYSIDVNPAIYDLGQLPSGPPSVSAIEGILAHELVHLVDYECLSTAGIIQLGAEIVAFPSKIERQTDVRAFERGFALGIKAYRVWIYGKLNPKALRVKRKRYYTPEEIDQWIIEHSNDRR